MKEKLDLTHLVASEDMVEELVLRNQELEVKNVELTIIVDKLLAYIDGQDIVPESVKTKDEVKKHRGV